MKAYSEYALSVLLLAMLAAIDWFLGHGVLMLASTMAAIWFVIALVLLSRPPGIPEFVSEETGSDEQYVVRKDVIPKLPWPERLRLSLSVACGSCFLIWVSLAMLAG